MSENPATDQAGPVVFINIFTVKSGKLDEFVALQRDYLESSRGVVPGWRGSRMHRSLEHETVVMMSMFDTIADHKRIFDTARFSEHIEKVRPLIEKAEPGYYQIAHEVGQV